MSKWNTINITLVVFPQSMNASDRGVIKKIVEVWSKESE